jgi:hypothetical protein
MAWGDTGGKVAFIAFTEGQTLILGVVFLLGKDGSGKRECEYNEMNGQYQFNPVHFVTPP